jgi:putative transposase
MSRKGYIIHDQQAVYFLTFTVVGWIDIFSRQFERLKLCRAGSNN